MKYLVIILSACLLACQGSSSGSLSKQLVGKWYMLAVIQQGEDVTAEHNPENDRWIEFKADGSFLSGGGPFGDNSGKWSIDESAKTIYIDSDMEDDDSEWSIQFEDDKTIWTGIGNEWKEGFQLIHQRISE